VANQARGTVAIATLVALGSIVAAVLAWASHSQRPASLPVVESHNLDPDQAACLSYGLVIRHSEASRLSLRLVAFQSLDEDAARNLVREIEAIDRMAAQHPDADAQLIHAFSQVALEGEAATVSRDYRAYRAAVTGRSAGIDQAQEACRQRAEFDIETMTIGEGGLP
jgi:hypothetical protein